MAKKFFTKVDLTQKLRVQIFEANLGFPGFDGLYLGNGLSYDSEIWWLKRYPYNLHCLSGMNKYSMGLGRYKEVKSKPNYSKCIR